MVLDKKKIVGKKVAKKATKKKAKKVTKKISKSSKISVRPIGHPTKYDTKYNAMLIEHMSQGLTYETFGNLINTSMSVIYNWEKRYPIFKEAKKLAFGKSMEFWERKGIQGMLCSKNFSSAIWIFNMKNRFGWTDKKEVAIEASEEAKKTFGFNLDDEPID